MEPITIVLLVLLAGTNAVLVYLLIKNRSPEKDTHTLLLQQQLQELARTVDTRLARTDQSMQTQLSESSTLVREVTTASHRAWGDQ